jgi:two-component system sensor histidine kinase EvgS
MLRKLIIILLLLLASCKPIINESKLTEEELVYAAGKIITVGADANFQPYTSVSSTGETVGLSIDVLKKVSSRTGLRFNVLHYNDRAEMMLDFYSGRLDILAAVNPSPEQLAIMGLTEPYALLSTVMLLNSLPINFPLRVGYAPNYFGQDRLNNLRKQVTILALENDHAAFRAMMAGTVDGVVTNLGSAYYFEAMYHRHFKTAPIEFPYALSFGYQPTNARLGNIMQKAVSSLTVPERRELKLIYEAPPAAIP